MPVEVRVLELLHHVVQVQGLVEARRPHPLVEGDAAQPVPGDRGVVLLLRGDEVVGLRRRGRVQLLC